MKKERNNFIDIVKGIGIFLVVLGHQNGVLTQEIYSFHMPLFFFLSGIFHKNYDSYSKFVKRKFKALMIPYFIFASSLFLFWLFISRNFGESSRIKVSILENFMGIFFGANIEEISQINWGATLWFLPCLFLITNIYYFFEKLAKKNVIIINFLLIIVAIFLLKLNVKYFNIWKFLTALFAIPFYSFGKITNKKILNEKNISWIEIILLFIINIVVSNFNGKIDMNSNKYNNFILFYISAFSGIFFLIFFIKKINLKNKILEFLGRNTLVIFAYHLRVNIVITIIVSYILRLNITNYGLSTDIGVSIIQIILCLPLIYFFNKIFRTIL